MGKSRRQYAKPKESPAGLAGSQAIAAALAALLALLLAVGVSILKPLSLLRTPPPCTVDRRANLSAEQFMAEYDGAPPAIGPRCASGRERTCSVHSASCA